MFKLFANYTYPYPTQNKMWLCWHRPIKIGRKHSTGHYRLLYYTHQYECAYRHAHTLYSQFFFIIAVIHLK